jgi:hypothetical protein
LHAAVARDANDDIFSIAYVVCESETRETWTWFLWALLEDIGYLHEHMWLSKGNIYVIVLCSYKMYSKIF